MSSRSSPPRAVSGNDAADRNAERSSARARLMQYRGSSNTGRFGEAHEIVAAGQHVVERAERVHVVAAERGSLDPPEQIGEIEIALAWPQVNLEPVAEAVGEADFVNPREIEHRDEPGDRLPHEPRVVG